MLQQANLALDPLVVGIEVAVLAQGCTDVDAGGQTVTHTVAMQERVDGQQQRPQR